MQGHRNLLSIHIPGTLAANVNWRWQAPFDCRLAHVSAVGSNANDASLSLGVSSDPDSILTASAVGDSDVPAEYGRADWAGTNPSGRLNQGDILVATVDFDGAGGTAAQNLTVVLTLVEG
ncbi:MAG: hypothetical protein ACRDHL_12590 [Candidatus Promineifilaceae bacterium]